jgi:hypothetical protein
VAEEYCWAITRRRCVGHNEADQVPVCWGLDYSWLPFCMHIPCSYIHIYKQWGSVCLWIDVGVQFKSKHQYIGT